MFIHPPLTAVHANYQVNAHVATIVSTNNLSDIENLLDQLDPEGTLVLWDVDQTLHSPDDAILKPDHEKLMDRLMGGKKVLVDENGTVRYLFREILMSASHSLVDPKSLEIIRGLQNRNIPVPPQRHPRKPN